MTGKERMVWTRQSILEVLKDGQEHTRMDIFERVFPEDNGEIMPSSWHSLKRSLGWLCGNSDVEWRFCQKKDTILFKICAPKAVTG